MVKEIVIVRYVIFVLLVIYEKLYCIPILEDEHWTVARWIRR